MSPPSARTTLVRAGSAVASGRWAADLAAATSGGWEAISDFREDRLQVGPGAGGEAGLLPGRAVMRPRCGSAEDCAWPRAWG